MADLDKLFSLIKKEKNRLDILFASAGICEAAPVDSITEKHFEDIFNVNVKGVLFTVQKALPIFVDGGAIILNGSVASIKVFPVESVYCATKAVLRSFARCWAVDLKERRIRVSDVSPEPIDTAFLRDFIKNENEKAPFLAATTMNRIGTADEVAKVVVFLASDDSSYITGIQLFVDGGMGQM